MPTLTSTVNNLMKFSVGNFRKTNKGDTIMYKSTGMSEIALRRKKCVLIEPVDNSYIQTKTEKALTVSMLKNIQSIGFAFSKDLFEATTHFNYAEIEEFYKEIIPQLKKLKGADVKYTPMYPNFPQQVMDASEAELFINAIIHYWSYGIIVPTYEKNERLPLIDTNDLIVLSIGSISIVEETISNLLKSPTNLSESDRADISICVEEMDDFFKVMPDEIPLKENVAFVCKLLMTNFPNRVDAIKKYFKTATDVLRLIVVFSDGDISLSTNTRFKSFKRCYRRVFMDLLANCNAITEDLYRHQSEWLRVGEVLHPFEFKNEKYIGVRQAFDDIRNHKKPLYFSGKVNEAINRKDMKQATDLLTLRPGEFARKLDKLIRDTDDKRYVISKFADVSENVSTPVLLQVREHFANRASKQPIRVVFPKGNVARSTVINAELSPINPFDCKIVVDICSMALINQYKNRNRIGKVYLDDDFRNFLVPFSQRSASKAIKTVVRGSRIPINPNSKFVRGFIWWTNQDHSDLIYDNRVDLDLSAAIYNEKWEFVEHVSYTNLRSQKYAACHSGDIVDGGDINGNGVAEFIDFDIDAVSENAGRYVVFQVYSFTGQHFSELSNARFGWMEREDVNSGEIFEPKTVEMKLDLTSNSATSIPVIFDCKERKFIWCDMNLRISDNRFSVNNIESNLRGVTATCYALANINKPNLHDLVSLNVLARGDFVEDKNKADIIFSNDKSISENTDARIITAFDIDYFMGNLI